jgi:hypothetical protein
MNNLDIVLAMFPTLYHRFLRLDATAAFQAATCKRNFKLSSAELFPNHKTDDFKNCIKFIRTIDNTRTTNYLFYHIFEGVFSGRRRRVAILKS